MFRKLVTNVPFSPALVGQLGFYARRLKREEATRRLGLVFTALALVVQSFAVFTPPENANAANASDFIRGGVDSKQQFLQAYDRSARGNGDLKAIFDYAGITRAELAAMQEGNLNSKGKGTGAGAWKTWGRVSRFSPAEGEVKHVVPRDSGGVSTVYSRPLWRFDSKPYTIKYGSSYPALFGYSKKLGQFAIMKDCGNLVTTKTPKPAPQGNFIKATCQTITGAAYDARNRNRDVKVYLYFGGPPGKGERSRAIKASLSGNKFKFDVPQKYQTANKPTRVWGSLVPLPGWGSGSVQFGNTALIPGDCVKPRPVAAASCTNLELRRIDRTNVSLIATATTANGASIKGYTFEIRDSSGNVVESRTINSSGKSVDSGRLTLANDGSYTARVVVATSVGNKTGGDCAMNFRVAPPENCPLNPDLTVNDPRCEPCPENPQLWAEDPACEPETIQGKTGTNLTQAAEADAVTARAGDRIEYTIYVENTGQVPATATLEEQLTDVLEYATLQNNGGGRYEEKNEVKLLSWGDVTLQPGEKQSRTFVVQLLEKIPVTAQGQSEPGSYDCIMTNAFGNTVSTKVDCAAPKLVEQTVKELPKTGPTENVIFGGGLLAVVTYFWGRSRQLGREIRLVRKEVNAGVI